MSIDCIVFLLAVTDRYNIVLPLSLSLRIIIMNNCVDYCPIIIHCAFSFLELYLFALHNTCIHFDERLKELFLNRNGYITFLILTFSCQVLSIAM